MMRVFRPLILFLFITSLYEARKPKPKPKPGCKVGELTYKEGQALPPNPSRPCEKCVCKKSKVKCYMRSCPRPQERYCVKEGECCASPPPCPIGGEFCGDKRCGLTCKSDEKCIEDQEIACVQAPCCAKWSCFPGATCTTPFKKMSVAAWKGKKTYKFSCDFSMVYNNDAVDITKSSVKCKGPKTPKGLSTKVNLNGNDGKMFTLTVLLRPFAITAATVKGAKCNHEPPSNPCPYGKPLTDASGSQLFCGRGPNRQDCPSGSSCLIHPADKYAVCCTDETNCKKCESVVQGQKCGQDSNGSFRMNCSECCHTSPLSSKCAQWRCDAGGWLCQEQCPKPDSGCIYNNRLYPVGETINIVDKCSILTCKVAKLGPHWDIEILGCSCCQHNGQLLKDGEKVKLYNGQVAKCCDGQMVTAIDIPGGLGTSEININENGQNFTQQNVFNYSTGLLTVVVPPHIAILQQNFTETTSMFHEASDASIIKGNSSCVLSDIPDDTNVYGISQYFEQLKEGTAIWDSKNVEIVYDMKIVKSIVGTEGRKALLPAMDNLCNNEVIKKTENRRISKENYESLVNGEIIFLKDDAQEILSFCATNRSCTKRWPDACSNNGWYNPALERWITMHRVSATSICLTCCMELTPLCNCTAQFPNLCPCIKITTKEIFEDCKLMENGGGVFPLTFQDDDGTVGTQLTTYNPNNDERSVKIHVPSHGETQETTVLMHAHSNGYWHASYVTNNMMIKMGKTCHIRTLPINIFPIDIALGIKNIEAGNFTLQPEDEKKKYSILMNDGLLTTNEVEKLNSEITEMCNDDELIKYQEVEVSDEQFQALKDGGIIDLEGQRRGCNFQTKATSNDNKWGCWRWGNPGDGKDITVHGVIKSVIHVTCCIEDESFPQNCCDTANFCKCEDIVDQATFAQCMVPVKTTLDIEESVGPPEVLISQTFAYNRTGKGHLAIDVETHSDFEESTMILDKSQGIQILKRNTSCHLLPLNARDPMKIALNAAEIKETMNGPLTSAMETVSTSVLVPHPGEIPSLSDHIDICDGLDIILADEIAIDQAQYYELDAGQVITLPVGSVPSYGASNRMPTCTLLTKCASNNGSSCIRWPNPGTGASIAVHGLISTPTCLSCCVEGHDPMYCDCNKIIDLETFQQCLYPKEMKEIIVVITGAHGKNQYGNVDVFIQNENSPDLQLEAFPAVDYLVETSGGVGAWINNSVIVCQGTGGVEDGCLMINSELSASWINPPNKILTDPLTWGGASAKYKSGPKGDELGETWWVIGGDPQGTKTQEWNSILGANPWEPPVLPVIMNTPCMVAISDREVFVTSTPMFEEADTNLAWIYSRDYPDNGGWKTVQPLLKKRLGPACGFVSNDGFGWIVVAGGFKESSTEILDLGTCGECHSDLECTRLEICTWTPGPDLGKDMYGASLVTLSTEELVLFGDSEDILAINSTFTSWGVVGKMTQPRHSAVALAISAESVVHTLEVK